MPRYACNTAALSLPHVKLDWTSPLLKHVRATSNPSWIGNVSGTRQRRLPRRHPSSSTGCISRTAETASLKPVYPASLLSLSLSLRALLPAPSRTLHPHHRGVVRPWVVVSPCWQAKQAGMAQRSRHRAVPLADAFARGMARTGCAGPSQVPRMPRNVPLPTALLELRNARALAPFLSPREQWVATVNYRPLIMVA
jgi:hypothetical protein